MSGKLRHRMNGVDGRSPCESRLRRILRRNKNRVKSGLLCGQRHGKHTGDGPDLSVQADLAQKDAVKRRTADFPCRRQNAQENRKVIVGSRLFQACGSKIHRNAADRKPKPGTLRRGTDPVPGLLYRRVRKSHDIEGGKSVCNKAFRRDDTALDAAAAQGFHTANHVLSPFSFPHIILHSPEKDNLFFPLAEIHSLTRVFLFISMKFYKTPREMTLQTVSKVV